MQNPKLLSLVFFTLTLFFGHNVQAQNESFIMTQIGPDFLLKKPWDLNYGPDDYLWVSERQEGVIVRINPTTAERDEIIDIPDMSSTAGQDGLLGFAFHKDFLNGSPYVYLSYTYLVQGQRTQKLVRYTYDINGNDGSLSSPVIVIDNLPCSNDHNSGRLLFGPDDKLYYSIGDQGANQSSNYCNPNLAQVMPTQSEIDQEDWSNYPGKILRLNPDGSIPNDNPMFGGVQSHIYSVGHRNPQGIVFGNNGILYSDEHGPNTDDEVNIIYSGKNYGWPNIAGYQDDQLYDYCNWSSAPNCQSLSYSSTNCHPSITLLEENTFSEPNYQGPLLSMFAAPDDYNFNDPACSDSWICRPNVAPSSIAIYESDEIPAWKNSLLVASLKRGRIYRLKLDEDGTSMVGDTTQHFYTQNRYRDIALDPDGKSFYIITDESGKTSDATGYQQRTTMLNPGTILKFTLDESTDVSDEEMDDVFHIWPNPVSDKLYVELKNRGGNIFNAELGTYGSEINYRIYNQLGARVKVGKNISSKTPLNISVSNLKPGMYYIRLNSGDKIHSGRFIKK